MKEQKIFRLTGFGNLSAIATVLEDGNCWVRYYNGLDSIEEMQSVNSEARFIIKVESNIREWCEENGYNLWSY